MKKLDLSLYLVTDEVLAKGRPIEWIVEEAVKGGVTMVQLREKESTTRDFVERAIRLKSVLSKYDVPLIINDRLDVVLASDADGLHIGQSDMPYHIARKILGKNKIIGLSVESLEDADVSNSLDVDYIGISPVFSTPTKTDTKTEFGLEGIKKVTSICRHPSVGIGGINLGNAADIVTSGTDGIAVVSAIMSADDPYLAASELKKQIVKLK